MALAAFCPAPSPPPSRLLGMPTEYAETYLEQHRISYKNRRLGQAILGSLVGVIVVTFAISSFDL